MAKDVCEQRTFPRFIPPIASALGIGVSCLVLTGWAMNLSALRSVVPGQPQMVPNTAITFILASVSVWMLWRGEGRPHAQRRDAVFVGGGTSLRLVAPRGQRVGPSLGYEKSFFSEEEKDT